ncbi:MAG: wax ester/triacylglycerol synthase family O-acyltransferase [Tetrasphaera sp.]
MVDRLTALDASFLTFEDSRTPMHVGQVLIFRAPAGFDPNVIRRRIELRLDDDPRFRRRLLSVPGHLANPVWVDDGAFDLADHVHRSALPSPGNREQLGEFVARVTSRQLDRAHPLWEVDIVEGLQDGRLAVVTKTHQAMIDEAHALELAGLVIDAGGEQEERAPKEWSAQPEPSRTELVGRALVDAMRSPRNLIETVRAGAGDLRENGRRVLSVASALARAWTRPQTGPLDVRAGTSRRFAMVDTDLDEYRQVRRQVTAGGSDIDVHDVALAVVTGALRSWLQTRGESIQGNSTMRAMVPVSLDGGAGVGSRVHPLFVDLPIGEGSPIVRLLQVAHSMRRELGGGTAVKAATLAGLGGFAAPRLHSLGARVGAAVGRRLFALTVTNVPGPTAQLHCGRAVLEATYPVMPIGPGQSLSVGMTSYHGQVHYGLLGDRIALSDLDVLAGLIDDSLAELLAATRRYPR